MNLTPCDPRQLAAVRAVEAALMKMPQTYIEVRETLHDGVYVRTAFVPAGVALVGALIKVPNTLAVCGHCKLSRGSTMVEVDGFEQFTSPPGRKTAFVMFTDTWLAMSFRTQAETVEQARKEFTDDKLQEKPT